MSLALSVLDPRVARRVLCSGRGASRPLGTVGWTLRGQRPTATPHGKKLLGLEIESHYSLIRF